MVATPVAVAATTAVEEAAAAEDTTTVVDTRIAAREADIKIVADTAVVDAAVVDTRIAAVTMGSKVVATAGEAALDRTTKEVRDLVDFPSMKYDL